jgi:hypothetical protein
MGLLQPVAPETATPRPAAPYAPLLIHAQHIFRFEYVAGELGDTGTWGRGKKIGKVGEAAMTSKTHIHDSRTTKDVPGSSQGRAFVSQATAVGTSYTRGLMKMTEEMRSFMADRMDHNRTTFEALVRAKSMEEFVSIQRDWLRAASDEYASEVQRLIDINAEIIGETVSPAAEVSEPNLSSRSRPTAMPSAA